MAPVSSFFMDTESNGGEFQSTESKLEFRYCTGDDDYPFEVITVMEDGTVAGLDLTLVDSIKLYNKLGEALTDILIN